MFRQLEVRVWGCYLKDIPPKEAWGVGIYGRPAYICTCIHVEVRTFVH